MNGGEIGARIERLEPIPQGEHSGVDLVGDGGLEMRNPARELDERRGELDELAANSSARRRFRATALVLKALSSAAYIVRSRGLREGQGKGGARESPVPAGHRVRVGLCPRAQKERERWGKGRQGAAGARSSELGQGRRSAGLDRGRGVARARAPLRRASDRKGKREGRGEMTGGARMAVKGRGGRRPAGPFWLVGRGSRLGRCAGWAAVKEEGRQAGFPSGPKEKEERVRRKRELFLNCLGI